MVYLSNINTPKDLEGGGDYKLLYLSSVVCFHKHPPAWSPNLPYCVALYFSVTFTHPFNRSASDTTRMILVTPELDVPPPFRMTNEEIHDLHEKAHRVFNTVEFLKENGLDDAECIPTEADRKEARAVFMDSPATPPSNIDTPAKALMLKALLNEYDFEVVRNAQQLRSYIKLKLLEKSDCGNDKVELKALEMLGKLSDVGAFVERVEVNVTHRTTEELENELATKLAQYMGDIIDVESREVTQKFDPLPQAPAVQVIDIDAELGVIGGELEQPSE